MLDKEDDDDDDDDNDNDDDEDDDDVDNDCLDWVFSRLYGQCIWELACVMNFLVICLTRLVE